MIYRSFAKRIFDRIFPYLIDMVFDDSEREKSEIASMLIENISLDKYGKLMTEVKTEWRRNNYDKNGAYIAPSPLMNVRNYIKKVLSINAEGGLKSVSLNDIENSLDIFHVYPNPINEHANIKFYLEKEENVRLSIFDMNGNEVERIVQNKLLQKGKHSYLLNASEYTDGIYICQLQKGSILLKRKILIKK